MPARELTALECRQRVDPATLPFKTTATVEPLLGIASQERALEALRYGLEVEQPRFHVVVIGDAGSGRTFCARHIAREIAKTRPTPDDILLLPNPEAPTEPTVLMLPAGDGRPFTAAMEDLHEKLVQALRSTIEGERFKQVRSRLQRRVSAHERELEAALREQAATIGVDLKRTDSEIELSSVEEDTEPSDEAVQQTMAAVEEFEGTLASLQDKADSEFRGEVKTLIADAIRGCFSPVHLAYEGREQIQEFLTDVEAAVVRELRGVVDSVEADDSPTLSRGVVVPTLLTEHEPGAGAPVVEVPYPTLAALFGRSHAPPEATFPPEPGFAVAGALHQANGGFLILPASALLKNEALYEQLKACLLAGTFIVPEHNPSYYRGTTEELLFPRIPVDVKVILVAGPYLYKDLHDADPEFSQLFKVQAWFEPTLSFKQALETYPGFMASHAVERGLPHMTAGAVSELMFYGGRLAESQTKVTAQLGLIAEVAVEAGYLAKREKQPLIDTVHVQRGLAALRRRAGHYKDYIYRLFSEGTIRIDIDGHRVGQVNAVSVMFDGPQMFGRPCRVTAVVYAGTGGPVNIAREVEMSGPLHSKGVLILTGYLASRFAQDRPLSFGASLVFEQTYEPIDGDSASSTELYALLSALSGIPLRQDLAVTGSVDQQGTIQPVGGINEKVESFFDVCSAKGLSGTQGVLIPASNRDALMLREDVVQAVHDGRFHVYAVETVEQGIELLAGMPAGVTDHRGHYPARSIFGAAQTRLERFYQSLMGPEPSRR